MKKLIGLIVFAMVFSALPVSVAFAEDQCKDERVDKRQAEAAKTKARQLLNKCLDNAKEERYCSDKQDKYDEAKEEYDEAKEALKDCEDAAEEEAAEEMEFAWMDEDEDEMWS